MSQIIFEAQTPRKESICVFAKEKVGKTTSWLEIALRTDTNFYVFDSDDTFWASVEDFPELESQLDRFTIYSPDDWNDYRRYANEIVTKCSPGDWIPVDRIDVARDKARDHFLEEVFGKNASSWVTETLKQKRDEGKKGSIHTEIPWSEINSTYYSWCNYLHRKAKANVFWAANAKKLVYEGMMANNVDVINTYNDVKHMPGGGNDFGYIPHTILYLNKSPKGVRKLTTIGDRGRKNKFLNAQELAEDGGFFLSYMIPVAGWRPKKKNG